MKASNSVILIGVFSSFFVVTCVMTNVVDAQTVIAEYPFNANSRSSVDSDINSTAGNFLDGGGFSSSFNSGAGNLAPSIQVAGNATNNSEAASISGGDFYEFTVTPAAGQAIIPSSLQFNAQARASGTGGMNSNFSLYWSGDNFSSSLGTYSELTPENSSSDFTDLHGFDLSGLPAKGQPITFRAVVWDGSGSPNKHNRLDNVTLSSDFLETQTTFNQAPSSVDNITGESQGSSSPSGYYTDSSNNNVGVGGSSGNRFNRNAVLGFELPTLDGPIISAGLTLTKTGENGPIDVDLYGLATANPDGSGTSLFLEANSDSNPLNVKIADDLFLAIDDNSTTRTADVTDFILSLYSGTDPSQIEAFFRLNPDEDLSLGSIERSAFGLSGANLSIITANANTAVPEPSTFALAGLGLVGLAFFGWRKRK